MVMIFAKTCFTLLIVAGGPALDNGLADAAGLRSPHALEKEHNAIAGLKELVEADEHFNVLALLREAGIHELSASWECNCEGNDGGLESKDAAVSTCECKCKARGEQDGWDPIAGHGGEGIPCILGIGGELNMISLIASSIIYELYC